MTLQDEIDNAWRIIDFKDSVIDSLKNELETVKREQMKLHMELKKLAEGNTQLTEDLTEAISRSKRKLK